MLGAARCARALGAARHSAAALGALAPRRALQGGPRAPKMQPHDVVQEWFDDGTLIVPSLNIFRRFELYLSLRLIKGLDLREFLAGTAIAYPAVMSLMYAREWEGLRPLTSAGAFEAMRATMEEMAGEGHRVELDGDGADAIDVLSCRLRKAEVLVPDEHTPAGTVHLHVDYEVEERLTIVDCHRDEPIAPFDGRARVQRSTWVYEGIGGDVLGCGGEMGGPPPRGRAGADAAEHIRSRVGLDEPGGDAPSERARAGGEGAEGEGEGGNGHEEGGWIVQRITSDT